MKLPCSYQNAIVVDRSYNGPLELCKLFGAFLRSAITDLKIETEEDNFTLKEYLDLVILAHKFPTIEEADTLKYEEDYIKLESVILSFNNDFYDVLCSISPDIGHLFQKVEHNGIMYYGFFDNVFVEKIKQGELDNDNC